MRRTVRARVSRAIEMMERVGHRGRCPACHRIISHGDRAELHHGKLHHRACARYERKVAQS